MPRQESAGGRRFRHFPATRRSVVAAFRGGDSMARRRAWDEVVESYWQPVCAYLRWHWQEGGEDARDLTQEFFVFAFDRRTLERYDPERARFRTWLRLCLDGFVVNQRKAAGRLKRGCGRQAVSLDGVDGADRLLAAAAVSPADAASGSGDPEVLFHREWVRALFGLAVEDLRRHCAATGRTVQFQLFARYDLDGMAPGEAPDGRPGRPTYESLAAELGLTTFQVTNHLAAARRLLRRLVLRRLRRLTASDAEFRAESRALLGIEVPAAGTRGTAVAHADAPAASEPDAGEGPA